MVGVRGRAGVGGVEAGQWMLGDGPGSVPLKSARGDNFIAALRVGCTRVYEQVRRRPALYSAQITGSHIA